MGSAMKQKVLIDSDVTIHFLNGRVDVHNEFRLIGKESLVFSVVTEAECSVSYRRDMRMRARILFRDVMVAELNEAISRRFRGLVLAHAPRTSWIPDALIASTAIEYGWQLYTLNRKDFDFIPELTLYKPKAFTPS